LESQSRKICSDILERIDERWPGDRVTDAQVEVEFVINTNGTVWGDSKSPTYLHMVEAHKQAKEGTL
jgi:hypothetical protein